MSSDEKQSLKYPHKVPKGYEISKMRYTFDFINLVLKHGSSIDKAIEGVANEYNLSEAGLRDYLIENKYILNRANVNEFSKQLRHYNTKSLKKILKRHGLKTSGKRERIEKRIMDNNIFSQEYYLSSKSRTFYKNKKRRIRIFDEYLDNDYYFTEFNEFYMDNYRKKEAKIPVEFINLHIARAIEDKSHYGYLYNCEVMADHYLKKENYRKMLEYGLKTFCMNLNPIWELDNLKGHLGLKMDSYDNFTLLQEKLSKNTIINTYYLIWDSFNFEKIVVSKYDGYRCLKDILNHKDYQKINRDLSSRFYENEDLKIKTITQKTLFDF